jgi:hypothetical protein
MTRFSWEIDGWEPPDEHGDPLDPHDTLADPERHAHLARRDDPRARDDREADAILSDFGAVPLRTGREVFRAWTAIVGPPLDTTKRTRRTTDAADPARSRDSD